MGYYGLGFMGGLWGFLFYYLLTCMRGLRGPMMLNITQKECPSANRAGVNQAFTYLFYAMLLVLPPLARLFLRSLPTGREES